MNKQEFARDVPVQHIKVPCNVGEFSHITPFHGVNRANDKKRDFTPLIYYERSE